MTNRVAIQHQTIYRYSRLIDAGPQVVRLRPAPHYHGRITNYRLRIQPQQHFIHWQQDPHGNFLARVVFPEKLDHLIVDVDLVAEMTAANPFDFFLDPAVNEYPFRYEAATEADLRPFLDTAEAGPKLMDFVQSLSGPPRSTIDFLVDLNQRLEAEIKYVVRMEPGVQTCEDTLTARRGSCRDSSWLLVQILRHVGLAARFTSGYLVQLTPDDEPLDQPSGPKIALHAWSEVYLPGAGWIGLDPTSGLLVGEEHIPLACTSSPHSAAPISGTCEPCESTFHVSMSVTPLREDPLVNRSSIDDPWQSAD